MVVVALEVALVVVVVVALVVDSSKPFFQVIIVLTHFIRRKSAQYCTNRSRDPLLELSICPFLGLTGLTESKRKRQHEIDTPGSVNVC